MPQKNLFATLIGINAYPEYPLKGCVNDVLEMDSFLRKLCQQQADAALNYIPAYFLASHDYEKETVEGHAKTHWGEGVVVQQPTFQNLTTKAFDHLKQAKDGDICLFYYSGHGSTMNAPEAFKGHKSKLQNETIVCIDSRSDARDLIDKEIAYLLWDLLQGKNVHCVVIMDCCFAGNNTRAIEADSKISYRHTPDSKKQIPLEQYLGYDKGFYIFKPDGGVKIKNSKYVHLAASMDNQTAQETASKGGLFTSQLLEVLQKGGSARSYRDLMQTTRVSVRNRNPNQTPVEFSADDHDLDQPFLGGDIVPYKPTFEVRFDKIRNTWVLHGGAMNGLLSNPDNQTRVRVVGIDKEFTITEVFSDFSCLDVGPEDLDISKSEDYRAVISKYATPLLEVCVSDGILADAGRLNAIKSEYGDGTAFPFISVFFEKEKQDAPFQIRLTEDEKYVLVRTGNTVPLFKREGSSRSFLTNVDYVGKWLVACELKHTEAKFKKEDFIFRFEKIEGELFDANNVESVSSKLIDENGVLPETSDFKYINGSQPAFRLSIEINPKSNLKSCYVGALYLESKYKIRTDLISREENHLVKGQNPVYLKFVSGSWEFKTLPLSVDERYHLYNINEIAAYLKIVVSTQPLFLDYYAQPELELDDKPNLNTRDMNFDRVKDDAPEQPDWFVFTTRIRIIGAKKSQLVKPNILNDFGAFDMKIPEGFSSQVFAATGDDINKRIAGIKKNKFAQSTSSIVPPSSLFGFANTLDQPFSAGISGAANNSIQVLEFRSGDGGGEVSMPHGQEIKITPKTKLSEFEAIVPFGYDEESGMYFPMGYTDNKGVVHIDQLPPPSEGLIEDLSRGDEKERSLGGSIKLFFQKVAWSRITGVKEYDRLSLYRKDQSGNITEIAYLGSQRTQANAEQIKQALGNGEALLLVHGIIGDTKGMVDSVFDHEALYQPFAGVLAYDYENLTSGIEAAAKKLKQMLLDCGFGDGKRLTIVAHSMGGLVSRYLIEHLEGDRFVKKLIQCGTPNSGSEMADFRRKVTGWLFAGLNGVSIFQPYMAVASFLGKRLEKAVFHTLGEMDPGSPFLDRLNAPGKARPDVPYYLVGGDTREIAVTHPEDASLLEKIFETLKTRGLYTGLDLAVFDKAPNDMAVKVDRMKYLPWGGHDQAEIVDCDHMSYFEDEGSLGKIGGWIGS
jgi:pimeloyl-ACP methyl ester carboxylesterase